MNRWKFGSQGPGSIVSIFLLLFAQWTPVFAQGSVVKHLLPHGYVLAGELFPQEHVELPSIQTNIAVDILYCGHFLVPFLSSMPILPVGDSRFSLRVCSNSDDAGGNVSPAKDRHVRVADPGLHDPDRPESYYQDGPTRDGDKTPNREKKVTRPEVVRSAFNFGDALWHEVEYDPVYGWGYTFNLEETRAGTHRIRYDEILKGGKHSVKVGGIDLYRLPRGTAEEAGGIKAFCADGRGAIPQDCGVEQAREKFLQWQIDTGLKLGILRATGDDSTTSANQVQSQSVGQSGSDSNTTPTDQPDPPASSAAPSRVVTIPAPKSAEQSPVAEGDTLAPVKGYTITRGQTSTGRETCLITAQKAGVRVRAVYPRAMKLTRPDGSSVSAREITQTLARSGGTFRTLLDAGARLYISDGINTDVVRGKE